MSLSTGPLSTRVTWLIFLGSVFCWLVSLVDFFGERLLLVLWCSAAKIQAEFHQTSFVWLNVHQVPCCLGDYVGFVQVGAGFLVVFFQRLGTRVYQRECLDQQTA